MARIIKEYNESMDLRDSSLRALGKKHDVRIIGMRILILNGKDKKAPKIWDIGIKVFGQIDGLCKYHGYRQHFVSNFNQKH